MTLQLQICTFHIAKFDSFVRIDRMGNEQQSREQYELATFIISFDKRLRHFYCKMKLHLCDWFHFLKYILFSKNPQMLQGAATTRCHCHFWRTSRRLIAYNRELFPIIGEFANGWIKRESNFSPGRNSVQYMSERSITLFNNELVFILAKGNFFVAYQFVINQ